MKQKNLKASNYENKNVLIFGLGLNDGGAGMTEFFVNSGANVTVTDLRDAHTLKPTLNKLSKKVREKVVFKLGSHDVQDFIHNDVIVRNPAIPENNKYLKLAKEHNKKILMEIPLFLELAPCTTIGITGTKGKSTTSSLIFEMLRKKYKEKVVLVGNIGKSAVRELSTLTKAHIAVIEISDRHLPTMGRLNLSPNIAIITNVLNDHANWHGSIKNYREAKKQIMLNQSKNDTSIFNLDDAISKKWIKETKAQTKTVSLNESTADIYINDQKLYINGNFEFDIPKNPNLYGLHNDYNIALAISCAKEFGVSNNLILDALKQYSSLDGRQQLIKTIKNISFFNDTTSTNADSLIAAINRFSEEFDKTIIIAGGMDKDLDYTKAKNSLETKVDGLFLFDGDASEKILKTISKERIKIVKNNFSNMKTAVQNAYKLAKSFESTQSVAIVLSPGAASFNMFINEFDRGNQFIKQVDNLK